MTYKNDAVGTEEHQQNMEYMCNEVQKCLSTASYGGKSLQSYRGVKREDWVFTDEEQLKKFLAITEDLKDNCPMFTIPLKTMKYWRL